MNWQPTWRRLTASTLVSSRSCWLCWSGASKPAKTPLLGPPRQPAPSRAPPTGVVHPGAGRRPGRPGRDRDRRLRRRPEHPPVMTEVDHRFPIMGGRGRVVLAAPDRSAAELETVAGDIQALCEVVQARLTRFDPQSELSRFNRWEPGPPPSLLLRRLALAARWAGESTDGLVDATRLGELRRSDAPRAPLAEALAAAPARRPAAAHRDRGYATLGMSEDGGIRRGPGVQLDSGGLAKGLAADLAADLVPVERALRDLRRRRRRPRRRRAVDHGRAGRPRRRPGRAAGRRAAASPPRASRPGCGGATTAPTPTTCSTPRRASRPGPAWSRSPPCRGRRAAGRGARQARAALRAAWCAAAAAPLRRGPAPRGREPRDGRRRPGGAAALAA